MSAPHDPWLSQPLEGVWAIEASAGTGKTYTLATLLARLVLERGLGVGEILAVTFTEAATQEGLPTDWLQEAAADFASFVERLRTTREGDGSLLDHAFLVYGAGMSDGQASEAGCYATADAACEHLLDRPEVDGRRIIAAGWSLGSGVAIDLASRRPVAGLATHLLYRHKTRGWTRPWGGWKDVEAAWPGSAR